MGKKALIIGDTIIDQDINLQAIGLSLESPTIKTKLVSKRTTFGGAANVARFASLFDVNVSFLTCMSDINAELFLSKYNINLINLNDKVENVKTRFYISHGDASYKHLQINDPNLYFTHVSLDRHPTDHFIKSISLDDYDIIAFSDYGYNLITDYAIKKAVNSKCITFGASQVSGGKSNLSKYEQLYYIVCNEKESQTIDRRHNIIITKGAYGCEWNGVNYPGFTPQNQKNIIGAGDCFFAAFLAYTDVVQANKTASLYIEGKYDDA